MNLLDVGLLYLNVRFSRMLCRAPRAPLNVHLELTNKCNLRCSMCDIWRLYKERPELIDKELTKEHWFSIIEELKEMGTKAISITGGEPLLRDDIFEIIGKAKDLGFLVHLNTNGTINFGKHIKGLINSGIDSVTVSIDFPNERHDERRGVNGVLNKGIDTIVKLKDKVNRIGIGTTLMDQSISEIEGLIGLAKKLGVEISFAGFDIGLLYREKNKKRELYGKYLQLVKKIIIFQKKYPKILVTLPCYLEYMKDHLSNPFVVNWCHAGFSTCIVRASGDVVPCYQFPSAGNLHNESFKEIWNSERMSELRKKIKGGCEGCYANCVMESSLVMHSITSLLQFYSKKFKKLR